MISKKDFVDTIEKIKSYWDFMDEINHVAMKYKAGHFWNEASLVDTCIRLLEINLNLEPNEVYGTDISYFVFELDFGHKYEPGMVTDENGNEIDISSAEKLYDYLTELRKV